MCVAPSRTPGWLDVCEYVCVGIELRSKLFRTGPYTVRTVQHGHFEVKRYGWYVMVWCGRFSRYGIGIDTIINTVPVLRIWYGQW